MTIADEFRTRNFSIYGQWTGVLCIILCFALGIANIFTFHVARIIFSVICLVCSFVILFVEVPLLLRICPTSSKFDSFIRMISTNYLRAAMYIGMSAIQWISIVTGASSLIVPAVFLLFAGLFYGLAALKHQDFMGSKTLGGQGVAQMIVPVPTVIVTPPMEEAATVEVDGYGVKGGVVDLHNYIRSAR